MVAINQIGKKRARPYADLRFYMARKGEDTYVASYKIKHCIPHPKYDGSLASGFDIGICFYDEYLASKNYVAENYAKRLDRANDLTHYFADASELLEGQEIEVTGFPADEDKRGHLYTHSGPLIATSETALGGYVMSYSVDTTPGNSGSPIFTTDLSIVPLSERVKD